jgi:hypothetical protein
VLVGVTVLVPCGGCGPLQAPLATQAVTLFDDQLSVALCPKVMMLGLTVIARFGATGGCTMGNEPWVFQEQLTKAEACAQIATKPATKASVRERELLFFDTCMARACHCDNATGAGPCQFGPFAHPAGRLRLTEHLLLFTLRTAL